jgi:nucleoid DNA-binding protein
MADSLEDEVAGRTNVAPSVVRHVMSATFDIIAERLARGEEVSRRNFGTFEVLEKPQRNGTHPRTGEDIVIEARRLPRFRPFEGLKKVVGAQASMEGACAQAAE